VLIVSPPPCEARRDASEELGAWLTVYQFSGRRDRKRVLTGKAVYTTDLLPGFEVNLSALCELANRWPSQDE